MITRFVCLRNIKRIFIDIYTFVKNGEAVLILRKLIQVKDMANNGYSDELCMLIRLNQLKQKR